jgi:hypothetical protein
LATPDWQHATRMYAVRDDSFQVGDVKQPTLIECFGRRPKESLRRQHEDLIELKSLRPVHRREANRGSVGRVLLICFNNVRAHPFPDFLRRIEPLTVLARG